MNNSTQIAGLEALVASYREIVVAQQAKIDELEKRSANQLVEITALRSTIASLRTTIAKLKSRLSLLASSVSDSVASSISSAAGSVAKRFARS